MSSQDGLSADSVLSQQSHGSGSLEVPGPAQPLRLFFWLLWFRLVEFQINHVYLELIVLFLFLLKLKKHEPWFLMKMMKMMMEPPPEGASALKLIGSITEFQVTRVKRKLGVLTWRRYINHPVAIKLPPRLFPPHLKLGGA